MRPAHIQRYILTGILTVFPLWLTFVVFEFVLKQLGQLSAPWVDALLRRTAETVPFFGFLLRTDWMRFGLAVLVTLTFLYVLGWMAHRMVGKRLFATFDAIIERIPLVQSIYGGTKKLLAVLQTKPEGAQRVVLIDFPHKEMKAVGFVTRTVREKGSGRELAMVYVPTTPNPTSGYLEVVPVNRLTPTDWSVDQAMALIISGGAVSPAEIPFEVALSAAESASATIASKLDASSSEAAAEQ